LQQAGNTVKQSNAMLENILGNILPICGSCKKIRDDKGTDIRLNHTSGITRKQNSATVSARNAPGNSIRVKKSADQPDY